jgi:hypothetical protein
MKAIRILVIAAVVYVGIVAAFESLIGVLQPTAGSTLVLTTFEPDGSAHDRVVSRLEVDGRLYVAANHWPRAWYHRVLENPEVKVTQNGAQASYRAVPVSGEEHERVESQHGFGLGFRFLTGFPPRYFVRLDPVEAAPQ